MEIIDNKALVIKTRRPHLITDRIKKSAVVDESEGLYDVAVSWGLKEAQTLAKLRIADIPSTIDRDYTWTGKFTPFDHQKETSAFFTLHPKAFCFKRTGHR